MKTLTEILKNSDLPRLYDHLDRKTPTLKAQESLEGRTHYVEAGTLRYHKARILSALPVSNGAFYKIIESTALDYENTRRGYRAVVFDIYGSTIYCPDLDNCFKTKEKADKAFFKWFEDFNEKEHYRKVIQDKLKENQKQIDQLREILTTFAGETTA